MSKFTQEELEQRILDIENFIKSRAKAKSKMVRFPFNPEEHGGNIPADVVIAEAFGQLQNVIIGGLDKEGKWWFSSSMDDGSYAIWILEHFKRTLLDSACTTEFNEGREV